MKIIDLLNKIANDDERPKMIKVKNIIWRYDNSLDDYKDKMGHYLMDHYNMLKCLDYEVEIADIYKIEEEKKIPEKLEILPDNEHYSNKVLYGKINDIIDYLDYLKSKGE